MPINSEIFKTETNGDKQTHVIAYPTYNATSNVYGRRNRFSWREAINVLFDLVQDLHSDTRRADLDLFTHLDLQERRIDTISDARAKSLKTINTNFKTHRELIDGVTELFYTQAQQISDLQDTVEKQAKQIQVLAMLDTPTQT